MMKYLELDKIRPITVVVVLVAVALLCLIPLFFTNYYVSLGTTCLLFASFAVAWNIIGGYGAQISWCHSAFVAMGAYSNFILLNSFGTSPWLTLPLGIVISYLLATAIGYGTFKLRGAYFSIATIAFAEAVRLSINYFKPLTKGSAGMYVSYKSHSYWDLTFKNDKPFFYIALILLLFVLAVSFVFMKSKVGKYLSAINGDEDATQSLGIETFKIKLYAFQLSAMLCSVAGAIYASYLSYISPMSIAGLDLSIKIGVIAIVGGVGTLFGPVIGAFIVIPLIELTSVILGASGGSQLLYGLLLVIIVIFRPKGVVSFFARHKEVITEDDVNKLDNTEAKGGTQ